MKCPGEDMVRNCYQDQRLRTLCAGVAPTVGEIVAFRRENRALLKSMLVEVFKRALRPQQGCRLFPPGLKRRLLEQATARIDIARHLDLAA